MERIGVLGEEQGHAGAVVSCSGCYGCSWVRVAVVALAVAGDTAEKI